MLTKQTKNVLLKAVKTAFINLPKYRPISQLYSIEARFALHRLQSILTLNSANAELELELFLRERWLYIIQGTNMQYLNDFVNPANEACIAIARTLVPFKSTSDVQIPYLAILMPTLLHLQPADYFTSAYTEELDLKELILSDCMKGLIHIRDVLEGSSEDGILKYNFLVQNSVRSLSDTERNRLLSRHASVQKKFDALQARVAFKFNGDTVGAAVNRLIKGLRAGGRKNGADELQAGEDANVAILNFSQYVETLDEIIYKQLMEASKIDRFDELDVTPAYKYFKQEWEKLINPTFQRFVPQQTIFCVELIANRIEEILEANPGLYDLYSNHGSAVSYFDTLNRDIAAAEAEMNAALPLLEYHCCYSDPPPHAFYTSLIQAGRNFELTIDELTYFFKHFTSLPSNSMEESSLATLLSSICQIYPDQSIRTALQKLDPSEQTIIRQKLALPSSPLARYTVFKPQSEFDGGVGESDRKRICLDFP